MKMSAPAHWNWILLSLLTIFVICLKLGDSFVLPPSRANIDSVISVESELRTNSGPRHKRSVFSVPVKPQADCPEGSRRTEAGECVEVAPEIKGGGDKFLIDSLKNFYRSTTTRKPPRRRRTTTTTTPDPGAPIDEAKSTTQNDLTTTPESELPTVPTTVPTETEQPEPVSTSSTLMLV